MARRGWGWCAGVMLAVAGPASGLEFDPEHGRGARGTVTVVGSASTWLIPDRIAIELSVEARALTPLAAYDDLADRVERVHGALADAGVALDSEVTTAGLRLWSHTQQGGERVHVGVNRVMVERDLPADDPHAATRFIRSVLGAGATGFAGLSFGIDPKVRADAEKRLLERAVRDARGMAEIVASAEGRWVGRALRIAMVGPVHHSAPGAAALDFARASAQESASIPVIPGDGIRLEASVEVVFALE